MTNGARRQLLLDMPPQKPNVVDARAAIDEIANLSIVRNQRDFAMRDQVQVGDRFVDVAHDLPGPKNDVFEALSERDLRRAMSHLKDGCFLNQPGLDEKIDVAFERVGQAVGDVAVRGRDGDGVQVLAVSENVRGDGLVVVAHVADSQHFHDAVPVGDGDVALGEEGDGRADDDGDVDGREQAVGRREQPLLRRRDEVDDAVSDARNGVRGEQHRLRVGRVFVA